MAEMFVFMIGNTHKEVKEGAKGIGVRSKGGANHLCKVFVEPDSDGAGAAIEQVVFHLPQTFPNNKIVASGEGPYHFQRWTWDIIDVVIEITFRVHSSGTTVKHVFNYTAVHCAGTAKSRYGLRLRDPTAEPLPIRAHDPATPHHASGSSTSPPADSAETPWYKTSLSARPSLPASSAAGGASAASANRKRANSTSKQTPLASLASAPPTSTVPTLLPEQHSVLPGLGTSAPSPSPSPEKTAPQLASASPTKLDVLPGLGATTQTRSGGGGGGGGGDGAAASVSVAPSPDVVVHPTDAVPSWPSDLLPAGMTAADGSGSGSGSGNSSNAADVGGGDAVTQTPNVSQHLTVMPDGRTSSSDSSDLGMARLPQIAENEISLGKKLGSGGFGDVYTAEVVGIAEPVAVKRMKASESPTARETFEQEALHIFSIGKHEHVLQLHGVCLGDPFMMLVTDLCMGGDLLRALQYRKEIDFDADVLLDWTVQIVSGMRHIHKHNMYHRDLKPANILLANSGEGYKGGIRTKGQRLVIADFGLAKKAQTRLDTTSSTLSIGGGQSMGGMVSQGAKSMYATQVGTLMYMAPELIEKRKFCRGSDMWAFGVILWEMLTGWLPYSYELENDGIAIAYRVGYTGYKLKVDDDWPEPFGSRIKACFHRDHHKRPTFSKMFSDFKTQKATPELRAAFESMSVSWDKPAAPEESLEMWVWNICNQDYLAVLDKLGVTKKADFKVLSEKDLIENGFKLVHARAIYQALAIENPVDLPEEALSA